MLGFWGWIFLGVVIWGIFEKDKVPAVKKKALVMLKRFTAKNDKKNK